MPAARIVGGGSVDEFAGLDDVGVSRREVDVAGMLVVSLTAEFDVARYEDGYRVQVSGRREGGG